MSVVLLSDFYFIDPSIRLQTLAMALLIAMHMRNHGMPRFTLLTGNRLSRLMGVSAWFIAYMSFIDFIRGVSLYEVGVKLLSYVLIIFLLPAFVERNKPFSMVIWYRRFLLISIAFAAMQVSGLHYALGDIVPNIGIIGSNLAREELIDTYGRVTGATYNTIAFSMQMVILILLVYGGFLAQPRKDRIHYGILGILGLLLSQTRAALIGLIPAIVISYLIFANSRLQSAMKLVPMLTLALGMAWVMQNLASDYFPYLAKEIDESDTHRFWTNWYMTLGVLNESPLFGISPEQAWDVYFRHADRNAVVQYTPEMKTPTHHNQLGYYLRYYGLIGIFFLMSVYYQVLKLINSSTSMPMRIFLGSVIILDFLYSMTHNNKLLVSPLLWIFLSLALLPIEKANRTLTSATRGV